MKSVALYYPSLEHSGGIERVVIELCRIFREKGYPCVLFTDVQPQFYKDNIIVDCIILPQELDERKVCWLSSIKDNDIQYVITNGGFSAPDWRDIDYIHEAGAKVINTIHFSFPSPILFNEAWESFAKAKEIGCKCDAVATVNDIDSLWWRSLGCNAHSVQNPFRYYNHGVSASERENHTIVWVGRGAPPKKPLEALRIIAAVAREVPDVKLYMIGVEEGTKVYRRVIAKLGIADNVEIVPPTSEIGKYYQKASVHLLTSITESFCLVIAEAKSYRIPTVMYDIPFLELIEDGKGVLIERQGDIDGMAQKIVYLLQHPMEIKRLGEEAFTTLERFNDNEVVIRWQSIFDSLERGEKYTTNLSNPYETIIREIYSAWMNHCKDNMWKIDFFDNIERALGYSARGLIDRIMNGIMEPLKKIKRKIR